MKSLPAKNIDKYNALLINRGMILFDHIPRQSTKNSENVAMVATILKNFESVGFTLSDEFINDLIYSNAKHIEDFYTNSVRAIKIAVGANRKYKPMYPNFPVQVMEMDDSELYINAIMHYLGDAYGVRILPEYDKEKRTKLDENIKFSVLRQATYDDVKKIITSMISSKIALSESDSEMVKTYITDHDHLDFEGIDIPNKEIMSLVLTTCVETGYSDKELVKIPKTIVDVIRIAIGLSKGDVTLATDTKFKLSKKNRRLVLAMLDKMTFNDDNISQYQEKIKRLGEILHPGQYSRRYPNAYRLFDTARNKKIETFIGKVDIALKESDIKSAASMLSTRPGIFARRLDHMLRNSNDKKTINKVLSEYEDCVEKVSTPVLLQLINHFNNRNSDLHRYAVLKNGAKFSSLGKYVGKIDPDIIYRALEITYNGLKNKFSTLPKMGKVYLDDKLCQYAIPFSQRTASKSLRTVGRGSIVGLDPKDYLRFFIWWKQGDHRVDIDLSAAFYDASFNRSEYISFRNLRESFSYHSGDITSAPNGACEFIDIDINKATKLGYKYVVMTVHSFTSTDFCDLPECFAGLMTRDDHKKGAIFDPRTVTHKFDLTSGNTNCIPLVIDLHSMQSAWADCSGISPYTTIGADEASIKSLTKYLFNYNRLSIYDLLKMHVEARGSLVSDIKDADISFTEAEGFQFESEKITSQFL